MAKTDGMPPRRKQLWRNLDDTHPSVLFLVGAGFAGWLAYIFVPQPIATASAGLLGGVILAVPLLRKIAKLVVLFFVLFVLYQMFFDPPTF